jgi:hypothetical protein
MQTEVTENQRPFLNRLLTIVTVLLTASLVISFYLIYRINPNIGNGANQIAPNIVPTIINGITTSTSIIIGFSATIIGIMMRDFFQENRKAKFIMITYIAASFIYVTALLPFAYFWMTIDLVTAWKFALIGLFAALFVMLFVFLFFLIVHVNPPKRKQLNPTTQTNQTTSPENNQADAIKDNTKTVNIIINM